MEILRRQSLTIPAQCLASYVLYAEDATQDNYRAHQFLLSYNYKKENLHSRVLNMDYMLSDVEKDRLSDGTV